MNLTDCVKKNTEKPEQMSSHLCQYLQNKQVFQDGRTSQVEHEVSSLIKLWRTTGPSQFGLCGCIWDHTSCGIFGLWL